MYWYHWSFFGMHFFWWMFWVAMILILFSWAAPVPRSTLRLYREDPLGILQRRYAAGEITTDEYDLRKARIERDLRDPKLRGFARGRIDQDVHA
ncbi:MAG: SHOCT domain-containing protein [Deltaproteobacteria bacterium]